jgi:hypothetical protein
LLKEAEEDKGSDLVSREGVSGDIDSYATSPVHSKGDLAGQDDGLAYLVHSYATPLAWLLDLDASGT